VLAEKLAGHSHANKTEPAQLDGSCKWELHLA